MGNFGIFRGFSEKLLQGELPTSLGTIGSVNLPNYLLDFFPNAAAAYSLRKLSGINNVNAVRVRRALDNAEQDIGFDVSGNLKISDLTTFCSGTDGFVKTWYDQSGNAKDATQTTAANQPQIVSSGSVININAKPSVSFDGLNDCLLNNAGTTLPANISIFLVRSFNTYPNVYRSAFNWKSYGITYNSQGTTAGYGRSVIYSNLTTQKSDDYPLTTGQALDFSFNKQNFERNNFAATLSAGGAYGTRGSSGIGLLDTNSQLFLGNIQELIIYESDKNSDKANIKTNINTYYGIY